MKRLVIVDVSNFIFRAFFAIRPLTSPKGEPVNALYGTTNMILKIIQNYKPTHMIMTNDTPKPTFRKQKYPEYKANRKRPHDDLQVQFPMVNKMIDLMNISRVKIEGYEADDLIASIVEKYKKDFDEILIASGDKDLMQLVDDKVKVLDTQRDVIYTEEKVEEKFGVKPNQIKDYLSILGDASDNVPGVKGIGKKGAEKLLKEYTNLDNIYKNIDEVKTEKTQKLLKESQAQVFLARDLISLLTDAPIDLDIKDMSFLTKTEGLINYLDELNFKSIKEKIIKIVS